MSKRRPICKSIKLPAMGRGITMEATYCYKEETHLTVMKTSRFFSGDGFTVYDSKGKLVFRVETYGRDSHDEIVLMDAAGKCLLTLRRKRPSIHQRWEGFKGEKGDGQRPFFSVRRASIMGRSNVKVKAYSDAAGMEEYQIEGIFPNRCCTFYNRYKQVVTEVKRKMAPSSANVMLGKEVFLLCLKPGFNGAFAMGLVLVLDQMTGSDDGGHVDKAAVVDCPTEEHSSNCVPLPAA